MRSTPLARESAVELPMRAKAHGPWGVAEQRVRMSQLSLEPGAVFTGILLLALGIFCIIRGIQLRMAEVPWFVEDYRGWSCPSLSLPIGGAFLLGIGAFSFEPLLPFWLAAAASLTAIASFPLFMLGMFVWFPWFLLPGWYRRARKAGVPRHDPQAMARFKRLTKAQQRTTTWPNLPDNPDAP